MRWGIRKQHATATQKAQCVHEDDERERGGGKGKVRAFSSFSPLSSWLISKLKGKEKPPGAAAAASTPNKNSGTPAFPAPRLPKRATSPSPAAVAPRRSPAADVVPRRLSVGNDNGDAFAARRRHSQHRRRRHCLLGEDRDDELLKPLGRLIPFSLVSSPARPAAAAVPSETDRRRRRRRKSHSRRVGTGSGIGSGRRSSFSGRRMRPAVRVRSPRRGELAGHLAVVRRTRDPQRAFRESMVEMVIASGGRPEELERLLACYLSLNADEHHDCIVKVFRQVWFEYVHLLLPRPNAGGRCTPRRRL